MSKLGDLIVRMRLDSKDYEKGLKKSKDTTSSFGASFGNIFKTMTVKVAAVTAAIAGVATAMKKIANQNQQLGDAWNRTTASMKGAWDSFMKSLASFDMSNIIQKMKSGANAAKELANAEDGVFESTNAYKLMSSDKQERMADLSVAYMSKNLSMEERKKAANELLQLYKEVESIMPSALGEVADAQVKSILSKMGFKDNVITDYFKEELLKFYEWLGTPEGKKMLAYQQQYNDVQYNNKRATYYRNQGLSDYQIMFLQTYNKKTNDLDSGAMVDAVAAYRESKAAYSKATARIRKWLANGDEEDNSVVTPVKTDKIARTLGDLPALAGIAGPEVVSELDDTVAGLDRLMAKYEEMGEKIHEQAEAIRGASEMMTNALVDGMISGVEELGYAVAGLNDADAGTVVKALLSPLADAAVSAGVLIMTTGDALVAVKEAFANWFGTGGWGAVAAGAALVAVGTAAKVGLAAIGSGKKSTSYANSSYYGTSGEIGTMNSELTVYVKGTLKGSDIILSGQSTQNSWRR